MPNITINGTLINFFDGNVMQKNLKELFERHQFIFVSLAIRKTASNTKTGVCGIPPFFDFRFCEKSTESGYGKKCIL